MLPEVVYHYPLADSIQDGHLKEVRFYDYSRVKTEEFVRDVVRRFWETYGEERREGLLPKMTVYCATIRELEDEFRPLLEKALAEIGRLAFGLEGVDLSRYEPVVTVTEGLEMLTRETREVYC